MKVRGSRTPQEMRIVLSNENVDCGSCFTLLREVGRTRIKSTHTYIYVCVSFCMWNVHTCYMIPGTYARRQNMLRTSYESSQS